MENEYTLLQLLQKLTEITDAAGRIEMDKLAELVLDPEFPQNKFNDFVHDLIEHRDDYKRRRELMTQLPSLNDEMNELIRDIQNKSESDLELLDKLIVFQEKFDSVSNEIDKIDKRIRERKIID